MDLIETVDLQPLIDALVFRVYYQAVEPFIVGLFLLGVFYFFGKKVINFIMENPPK